mmetsp:Transcript_35482/g.68001  ORF Transcript_35482/g.68001 Transcript_35482/m.68001 type:complete len:299 (-) Transcript_35482:247-1143(-)|eukprot:CAMPEP_0114278336 /NCGR_PEP_ID=MMETSP0059-20121206/1284_1 /TAXON_ID=36894 /ORGANISM="Pyramimonas parkeae, Strain CCMP726" /LENGTH=298 /DNA_ID=CAMNT_0001398531 /DNA_START=43 /DNA_END=939 /DNA_ORIENTATION=-
MVDYSKWDHLDVSSDEEESATIRPHVTRLEPGTQVTFGKPAEAQPSQSLPKQPQRKPSKTNPNVVDYSKWDALEVSSDEEEGSPSRSEMETQDFMKEKPEDSQMVAEMKINPTKREATTASRSEESLQKLTKNGSSTDRYHWSQTKDEVTVHIPVPRDIRSRDLRVDVKEKRIKVYVSATPNTAILEGTMYLQVAEDEIGDWEVLDWPEGSSPELLQSFRRLTITFRKVILVNGMDFTPGEGVVVWWKSFLEGDPTIDTTKITERKGMNQMQQTWKEAQEMFKNKVNKIKPIIISPDS